MGLVLYQAISISEIVETENMRLLATLIAKHSLFSRVKTELLDLSINSVHMPTPLLL